MCTNARFILWFDRFNPFHDNLIVSGGSDSLVQLWNVPKDEGDADDGDEPQPQPQTYDEHEDSVYGIAWSAVDPWAFLSLSYDGRVVCSHVPSEIKYKILL